MTAIEYARSQGFQTAKRLCEWMSFACYEAVISENADDIPFVGCPQIILEKNNSFRMATYDESLEIVSTLEE